MDDEEERDWVPGQDGTKGRFSFGTEIRRLNNEIEKMKASVRAPITVQSEKSASEIGIALLQELKELYGSQDSGFKLRSPSSEKKQLNINQKDRRGFDEEFSSKYNTNPVPISRDPPKLEDFSYTDSMPVLPKSKEIDHNLASSNSIGLIQRTRPVDSEAFQPIEQSQALAKKVPDASTKRKSTRASGVAQKRDSSKSKEKPNFDIPPGSVILPPEMLAVKPYPALTKEEKTVESFNKMLGRHTTLSKEERTALSSSLGIKPHITQSLQWTRMWCLEGRIPTGLLEGFDLAKVEQMFKDFAKKIEDGVEMRNPSQLISPKNKGKKYRGNKLYGAV